MKSEYVGVRLFIINFGPGNLVLAGKIVMNEDFVLNAEFAKAVDPLDGTYDLNLGVNYLF